jgi:hypothetical protein
MSDRSCPALPRSGLASRSSAGTADRRVNTARVDPGGERVFNDIAVVRLLLFLEA